MLRCNPRIAGLLVCAAVAALGGCGKGRQADPVPPAEATAAAPVAAASANAAAAEEDVGTPVKDRVATLGLLNKRNNLTQDIQLKSGEAKRIGNVIVKLGTCERTRPWEGPPETGAFVQVFVEERATIKDKLAWHKVFSGWLFKNSPSLNVVEHPVYDVWVKDCSMKFPGEDAQPAAAASSSSAAKPSGKASASPAPDAAPAPAAPAGDAATEG